MFKERFFMLLKELLALVIIVSIAILIMWGLISLPYNIGAWLMIGLLTLIILVGLATFVNWLIIEPIKFSTWYRNRKSNKKNLIFIGGMMKVNSFKEEVLNLIDGLESDVQDMRKEGETDIRKIIHMIEVLYSKVNRLEEDGEYLNG